MSSPVSTIRVPSPIRPATRRHPSERPAARGTIRRATAAPAIPPRTMGATVTTA
jgi:hypothetical protein